MAGSARRSSLAASVRADGVPADNSGRFEAFFQDHHAQLFAALHVITRNRDEAEEIMQDAFLRLWERWEKVWSLEDPVGYLYRTAMNLFRKRRRHASVALRRTVGLVHRDDEISRIETRVATFQAMASLSPRQRAVLVLVDLMGYSSEETSELLEIAPGTVRTHASRARACLARILGGLSEAGGMGAGRAL